MADLIYNSFREYMGDATIDLDGHVFKVGLLTNAHTPDATDTVWTDVSGDETTNDAGSGYTAAGNVLDNVSWVKSTTEVKFDADNEAWTTASFTCQYAVIYDDTAGDKLVCLFDFGGDKTVAAGTFTLQFDASDGIFILS